MELIETILITYGPLIGAVMAEVALIIGILVKIKDLFSSFEIKNREDRARDEKIDAMLSENASLRRDVRNLTHEVARVKPRGNKNDKKN